MISRKLWNFLRSWLSCLSLKTICPLQRDAPSYWPFNKQLTIPSRKSDESARRAAPASCVTPCSFTGWPTENWIVNACLLTWDLAHPGPPSAISAEIIRIHLITCWHVPHLKEQSLSQKKWYIQGSPLPSFSPLHWFFPLWGVLMKILLWSVPNKVIYQRWPLGGIYVALISRSSIWIQQGQSLMAWVYMSPWCCLVGRFENCNVGPHTVSW